MNAANSLLLDFKQDPGNLVRVVSNLNDCIACTTKEKEDRKGQSQINCHRCGLKGHYANELEVYQAKETGVATTTTTINTQGTEEEEED